jgi:membrane protein DedA with SNARE-associated domain
VYDLISWPGVVILMALETVIFLIPSEAVMPFAGWLLVKDRGLGFEYLLLAGFLGGLGSTAGSLFFYYAGYLGGRPIIARWGKYLFISEDDLDKGERFFAKYGSFAVFFGRFVPLVRTFVSVPAGLVRMDLKIFVIYTLAGSTIWATLLAFLGYQLGENYEQLRDYMGPADIVAAAGIAFLFCLYVAKQVRQSLGGTDKIRP